MINVEQTIISQYGASPTLTQLVHNIDEYIDPRADFDTFYDYVWNVQTAVGFGLDIWGEIVNVSRYVNVPVDTPNPGGFPFTPGPVTLTDDQYRVLIFVKALSNITRTTADSINQLLSNLFASRGRAYVLDMGSMTLRFTFEFWLEPFEYVIITQSGAMPRPAGVLATILQVDVETTFGFKEGIQFQPFDQGTFYVSQ